ncbi:MAG: GIY-YIG nuclease family protein [Actinobacteria bacterium]|nr:GIY-YIG nuclease family protein [Actinomycetota bacterium]
MKYYYVYVLASRQNGTLYIGITSDLIKRTYEHKNDLVAGFTNKYHVHQLVHYEQFNNAQVAIAREKQLKKWKRKWKLELIEESNPDWKDLYEEICS